jgi:hypothetical protein
MFINFDKKFLFIAIARTGSTTCYKTLEEDLMYKLIDDLNMKKNLDILIKKKFKKDILNLKNEIIYRIKKIPQNILNQIGINIFENDTIIFNEIKIISGFNLLPNKYHKPIKEVIQENPGVENFFKFCFVRNPYTRFLSSWKEFKKKDHSRWASEINNYKNFEDFCLNYKNTQFYKNNEIHFRTQTSLISKDDCICMDKIYKFENFEEEINSLKVTLDLKSENNYHERNTGSESFIKFYNNEMLDIVYEVYKDDFINFGYKKILK